jgi:DNA-binding response OmpR family regulator
MATTTERNKTILVIEDGQRLSGDLKREFEPHGYEIITYRDVTGVLVMARQIDADAVILDAQLRGAGSVVALKSLRRNVHTAAVPVIAAVGRNGPQEKDLLPAGATAAVTEPLDPGKLRAIVEKHLQDTLDFTHEPPAEVLAAPERLKSLEGAKVVDTPRDKTFDRLTKLTTSLLVAPTATMSLVMPDRQFFKSEQGLGEPWKSKRETPLSYSFCQWVVSAKDDLVIDDASKHPVLRKNLALKDLGVTAYAGVPLSGPGGEAIGSMCAIDTRARNWKQEDIATLHDLAYIANSYMAIGPQSIRDAIHAATRMLRRYGARLRETEREDLLSIIDEESATLVP